MTNATTRFQAEQYLTIDGLLADYLSTSQRLTLRDLIKGEEGEYFVKKVLEIAKVIRDMPKTYETTGIVINDTTVHLHYFRGNYDAWITEKDMGDGTDDTRQHQARGLASFHGREEAEWGYISIQELIENGVELDLFWTPCAMKDVK